MYIEWLIIYILYIQGGPKWYCNRVIFKYLTVLFFIGKEGMRSGPSRFRRGEWPPLPYPTPILDRGDAVHGIPSNQARSSWSLALSRSSLICTIPMLNFTL